MRLVIVTGMSGAGKTAALKMLEDMGFIVLTISRSRWWENLRSWCRAAAGR